jgi:hypothetical protein
MFNLQFKKKAIPAAAASQKPVAVVNPLLAMPAVANRRGSKSAMPVASRSVASGGPRLDVFLRLLVPGVYFKVLLRKSAVEVNPTAYLIWPNEALDILALTVYSNPLFLNSKLFDISAFANSGAAPGVTLYYIFSIPLFSVWLVVFMTGRSFSAKKSPKNTVSIEMLFKSAAWAERESSELFGIFFFFKKNNRKLITDYFFKIYPLLKWVPSIGFSEVYLSAEGFFANRAVKVFNSALA